MKNKIRNHVNEILKEAPDTKRVRDFKEELIINLEEKYEDLKQEGNTEEQAYLSVIEGIGDVDELISGFRKDPSNNEYMNKRNKRNALVVSVSVGLYILSLVAIIVLDEIGAPEFLAVTSFLMIAGIATCIIIYNFMSQPKYQKYEDTMVEEFKEWKSDKIQNREVKNAVQSIFWTLLVALYFIISFAFCAWAFSWIIFIIGGAISGIINLIFQLKA